MARQKQPGRRPAKGRSSRGRQEREAQQVQDLPNREAMSILTGLPVIPGLPPNLFGDGSGLPAPGDPSTSPPEPAPAPGDTNTVAPTNEATLTNLNSAGTTETTGASQDAPITQRA